MPHYVQLLSFCYPTVPKLLLCRNSFKCTLTTAALNTFTLLSGDFCTTFLKCFSYMSNVLTSLQFMPCVTSKLKGDRHIQLYIFPSTVPSSLSSFTKNNSWFLHAEYYAIQKTGGLFTVRSHHGFLIMTEQRLESLYFSCDLICAFYYIARELSMFQLLWLIRKFLPGSYISTYRDFHFATKNYSMASIVSHFIITKKYTILKQETSAYILFLHTLGAVKISQIVKVTIS